jgi:hypothetical protein
MMDINAIYQFPRSSYEVDVEWRRLESWVISHVSDEGLDLMPDFQRGHVWTSEQRSRYVEYILQGGEGGRMLSFNRSGWLGGGPDGPYQILDGLQRLTAARMFMRGEVSAFGRAISEYTGYLRGFVGFKWRIFELPTRRDILSYYLAMNAGGTPHSDQEIGRVRSLLEAEQCIKAAP